MPDATHPLIALSGDINSDNRADPTCVDLEGGIISYETKAEWRPNQFFLLNHGQMKTLDFGPCYQ